MYVVDNVPNSNCSGETTDSSLKSIPVSKNLRTWKRTLWEVGVFAQNTPEGALLSAFNKRLPSTQTSIDKDDLVAKKRESWRCV